MRKNNVDGVERMVYRDADGTLYSLDTIHGDFEICNEQGKHQGSIDFGGKPTSGPDAEHNLNVK